MPGSFQEILAAAIDDMVAHGFDSMERVERWTRELRVAAEHDVTSAANLDQRLRDGLSAIYRRMVDNGSMVRYHPGIERFTLERLKPALRAELDRRIMASANLIKLNRKESVDKTLRRFEGWSTSIPKGGTREADKRETKVNVRKALAQLPFEERRVLIDQGHKLIASINEIVANDGGAIAGKWRSNYRQPGYDYREDHKERDNVVYLVRDSWAHRAGLVKKSSDGYYDEHESAGQLPFCRCYVVWLSALKDLPDDMLTQKGRRTLTETGMHTNATRAFARADAIERHPIVDRDRDVAWMAVISRDGKRLYVDRTIPREVDIKGKRIDPAVLLWAHEFAEWREMNATLAAFLDSQQRQPTEAERVAIYDRAHEKAGIPAERTEAKRLGVDWAAWEAWSRGELDRLEHRAIQRPPPDPHVKPAPHDRRQPMEAVA